MKKIIDTIVLLTISIVLPLIFKLELLLTWPIWVVLVAGIFLGLSQPAWDLKNEKHSSTDRSSIILITIGVLSTIMSSVIEYSYLADKIIQFNLKATLIGFSLIVFGFGFRYYCIKVLGKFFTSEVRILNNHELIQIGPYKYLRHPSYLGAWLGVLGIAIFLHSLYGIVACHLIYFPAYIYRISCEEKTLTSKFPDTYPKYQKQTWKMFPYVF